jgi:phosphomannomutase
VQCKAGHAFIKERMRQEDAIYAGEMSAHHYFKDNFYADNGMIPMLLLLEILSIKNLSLKQLVSEWINRFPISGEINIKVSDAQTILEEIEAGYKDSAISTDYTDGLSLEYSNWRFNLRKSNTEPVIRLNVETKGNFDLMENKRDELIEKIKSI